MIGGVVGDDHLVAQPCDKFAHMSGPIVSAPSRVGTRLAPITTVQSAGARPHVGQSLSTARRYLSGPSQHSACARSAVPEMSGVVVVQAAGSKIPASNKMRFHVGHLASTRRPARSNTWRLRRSRHGQSRCVMDLELLAVQPRSQVSGPTYGVMRSRPMASMQRSVGGALPRQVATARFDTGPFRRTQMQIS